MSMVSMSLYDAALRRDSFIPLSMGYYDRPDMLKTTQWNAPAHRHNFIEIMYVTRGRASILFKSSEVSLTASRFILIDSMIPHALRLFPDETCSMLNIEFAFERLENEGLSVKSISARHAALSDMLQTPKPYIALDDYDGAILRLLKQTIAISDSVHQMSRRLSGMLVDMMLISISSKLESERGSLETFRDKHVIAAKSMIDSCDMSESVSIGDIATKLGISEGYLIKRFKRESGLTPKQYALGIRLDEAKRLLDQSDYSVIRIGASVGLSGERNFARLFKKRFGLSPSAYERQCRES